MSDQTFIRYAESSPGYLEKRRLRQDANGLLLWGLGVGGAIGGYFFSWTFALTPDRFWEMVIATCLMTIMYICLAYSIAELSSSFPYAGGFYAFARKAFGPVGGFICGAMITTAYLLIPMALVIGISQQFSLLAPTVPLYVWWLATYLIAVGLNQFGTRISLRIGLLFTVLALLSLFTFYGSVFATGTFNSELLADFDTLSFGTIFERLEEWRALFSAFPFAVWFFITIEQIPSAAEDTKNPTTVMPKVLIAGTFTLILLSFLGLLFNSGYQYGLTPTDVPELETPFVTGFKSILLQQEIISNPEIAKILLVSLGLIGLLASVNAVTFIYARHIFSLSRAGYLPRWLSVTNRHGAPSRILILGGLLGFAFLWLAQRTKYNNMDVLLLNTAFASAMISYMIVSASYIQLKREHPEWLGPYKSPLGIWGAGISGTLAFLVFITYLSGLNSEISFSGLLISSLTLIAFFVFYSRTRLVRQAPEESSNFADFSPTARQKQVFKGSLVVLVTLFVLFFARGLYQPSLDCAPNCIGLNFVGRNLSGITLRKVNLVEANLRRTNFSNADLYKADLSGAKLIGANFEGADLSEAKLVGADLTNANFSGAKLSEANLSGAKLKGANFTKVDLTETILHGVDLSGARLIGTNLSGVDLAGVNLSSSQLKGADLTAATLAGSTLSLANLSGAKLSKSDLSGALINRANLVGTDLHGANLSGVSLIGTSLASADLSGSQLVGAILIGADLNGTNLGDANLRGARTQADKLRSSVLKADVALLALNDEQRKQIVVDAKTQGAIYNARTIRPGEQSEEVIQDVQDVQAQLEESAANDEEDATFIKVGILYSLSGQGAEFGIPVYESTLFAIEEINASGGVLGQKLKAVTEDGASDWQFYTEKALKLLNEEKVVVVFGGQSVASRQAIRPIFEELNALLFHPFQYEGLENSANIFYLGADPTQQTIPAVEFLLKENHKSVFLVGSYDLFSRATHATVKAQIEDAGGSIAGEIYLSSDQHDLDALIDEIKGSSPTAILNTMSGDSNINFFKAFKQAGFTAENLPVMSIRVAEDDIAHIEIENIQGHFTTWNYYQSIDSPENNAFVRAYQDKHGADRVLTDPIHAAYASVYLWKTMVEQAGSTETDLIKALATSEQEVQYLAPGGLIRVDRDTRNTYKKVRVGVIGKNGSIVEVEPDPFPEVVKPDPLLSKYEWARGLKSLIEGE